MDLNFAGSTEDILAKDRAHNLHPFSDLSLVGEQALMVIVRGEGAYVYDSEGRRLIDGIGGLWCVNIGHGREEMADAIAEQIRRLTFYSSFATITNPQAAELSAVLARLSPGDLNHVFYSTSGSDANESAIRIVHHYFNRLGKPDKKQIISRHGAYHGSTYLTTSLTSPSFHEGWDVISGLVHHLPTPDPYHRPAGMSVEAFRDAKVKDLEDKILELGPENVACFIAEPILGAGGVIVPPAGYQRATWEVCRKHDVLYISDEVVTAFGRLGHMFASEDVFGVMPDVICTAKGITSGYIPYAATFISDKIHEVISRPGAMFYHGFTYTGHPVASAAALKNIEILEREDICARVRRTGPYFQEALQALLDLELVGDVRGSHLIVGIEYVSDRETKAHLNVEPDVARRVFEKCYARGLVARNLLPHVNLMSPTLILAESDIDEIVRILEESIKETMDDLVREGAWKPKS